MPCGGCGGGWPLPGAEAAAPQAQRPPWPRARAEGGLEARQAHVVWKHRRRDRDPARKPLPVRDRRRLSQMFGYVPELRILRAFVLAAYRLVDPDQSPHQARCRSAA